MTQFSVCVLLYGDHPELATRCLKSIANSGLSPDYVRDIRIGLNHTSSRTRACVDAVTGLGVPVITYTPIGGGGFKYPLMRKMFRLGPELAECVMWFDDDSFLTCEPDWWSRVSAAAVKFDMIGQHWMLGLNNNQWQWYSTQPWFNSSLSKPSKLKFIQGAWWCLKSRVIKELDWPIPELRHCGGDSLLGEVCRHKDYKLGRFDYGVRINACELGQHSKSPRRGYSEPVIGADYKGTPYSTCHQDFEVELKTYAPTFIET